MSPVFPSPLSLPLLVNIRASLQHLHGGMVFMAGVSGGEGPGTNKSKRAEGRERSKVVRCFAGDRPGGVRLAGGTEGKKGKVNLTD